MSRNIFLLLSVFCALLLGGCVVQPVVPETPSASTAVPTSPTEEAAAEEAPAEKTATEEADSPSFTAERLSNLVYHLDAVIESTPIQLVDGVYEDEANRIDVRWTETYALGELQGQPAAAVMLDASMGGSGIFNMLAVVQEQDGELVNVASALVGDRVRFNAIAIDEGEIVLDFVTQGPDEPLCCGTQRTLARYTLQGEALEVTATETLGTQDLIGETEVITFTPTVVPTASQAGSCFANAIGLGRADAWRCMTGNQIHDPCFQIDEAPTLICGAHPISGEEGFVLELTEPLPEVHVGDVALPWLIELGDGTICGLMTGTVPGANGQTAPYGCADEAGSFLMAEFDTELPVWFAQRVTFEVGEDGFSIRSSARQGIAAVWR